MEASPYNWLSVQLAECCARTKLEMWGPGQSSCTRSNIGGRIEWFWQC